MSEPAPGTREAAAAAIEAALPELGLSWQSPQPGSFLVRLEGQHKLATMTWLIAGAHSLHVEAFFCRQPDENHARFYRFLLERNGADVRGAFRAGPHRRRLPGRAAAAGSVTPPRWTGSWAAC